MRLWGSEILFLTFLCGILSCTAQSPKVSFSTALCPVKSLFDSFLGFPDSTCSLSDSLGSIHYIGITEVILFTFTLSLCACVKKKQFVTFWIFGIRNLVSSVSELCYDDEYDIALNFVAPCLAGILFVCQI